MSALDTQTLIDSLLRGVMISSVNRLVFKGGSLLSMANVKEGAMLGASSVAYDIAVRPVVKQVLPSVGNMLPNGAK